MSEPKKRHPTHAVFEEWRPCLPPDLQEKTEADWRAQSLVGRFGTFCKLDGQRSTTLWDKASVLAHFRLRFSEAHPECIEALIAAGFGQAQPQKKKRKTRRG